MVPRVNSLYPLLELPTNNALLVTVSLPVPPDVPARAVDRDNVLAVILTVYVELAAKLATDVFVVKPPDSKYVSNIANVKPLAAVLTVLLPESSC